VAWQNELPPTVQKSILARKPNNGNSIKINLSPNTINRNVYSMKDKKQKILLKDIRASIPDATAVYLFHLKLRLLTSHVSSAGGLNRKKVKCHYAHYGRLWGSEGTDPFILNISTRPRCVVSFTLPTLYPPVKKPRYQMN
jgi:hypothetical protein